MLAFLSNQGISKAQIAQKTVQDINPFDQCRLSSNTRHEKNAEELLKNHDVIIDATDNLVSRVIIHRAAGSISNSFYLDSSDTTFSRRCHVF